MSCVNQQAARLVSLCAERGLTVATAESLTAGLCAATIAEVPGSSSVLRGGFIVYATDLKSSLLGIDAQLVTTHGPVSKEVAHALAVACASRCGASIGIGLTGVAGPAPQDGHAVGEVYVAVSVEGETRVRNIREEYESLVVGGSLDDCDGAQIRARVRALAVDCALRDVCRAVGCS